MREEAEEEVYRVKREIVDTVTRRLNVQEREAWRKNEEFWAALRDHQPLKQCLSADERESVRRIWNRIWRRAGSVVGAGKDNWQRVARTPFRREFPSKDKSKYTYPTGRFTTWLRTEEIRHALAHGRLIKCYEALITVVNADHERLWRKLRNEVLSRYGRTCVRCGRTTGQMHIDHVNPWSKFPEQRYDPENLQVLCCDCHAWKQGTDIDFRPDAPQDR